MDINAIMRDLRESKTRARREEINSHFTPLGKRAWNRRTKKKKEKEDKEWEKHHSRKQAQRRYYEKNKAELNMKRAIRGRQPVNVYRKTKRREEKKGNRWEFDFPTWWSMWEEAPRPDGVTSAWKMKGGNPFKNTMMYRKDTEGPWSKENCYIGYKYEPLIKESDDNVD